MVVQTEDIVQVDLNEKQLAVHLSEAKVKVLLWSRRTGKNFYAGIWSYMQIINLPGSNADFVTQDIKQLKNASVPSMELVWKKMGLKEIKKPGDIGHYVKWKKPPHWFKDAHQEPNEYDSVISFWNGVRIQLLGLNSKNAGRGGTSDWMLVDEACFINVNVFQNAVKPRLSGPFANYPDNPLHRNVLIISSAPDTVQGQWVFDYKKLAEEKPGQYMWSEATVWDNAKVLGLEFIREIKRTTKGYIWAREYENIFDAKPPTQFYPQYNDLKHLYEIDYKFKDPHYHKDLPLYIGTDYNAGFECGVVGQKIGKDLYVQKEFSEGGLSALVESVCDYYEDHRNKTIYLATDATGNHRKAGSDGQLTNNQLKNLFKKRGWNAILLTKKKSQPPHKSKYDLINDSLEEIYAKYPKIRICRDGCPYLIRAIKMTPAFEDFKKDKSSEKDTDTPELATHFTDAFDYLIWYMFKKIIGKVSEGKEESSYTSALG